MLSDEIRNTWFRQPSNYATPILGISVTEYPAWCVKYQGEHGVAIPYYGDDLVSESFADAKLYNGEIYFGGDGVEHKKALILSTTNSSILSSFASLCAEFVSPGEDGDIRRIIEKSPVSWWIEWKELLGNKNIEDRVYDVLGELVTLKYLIKKGLSPEWYGPSSSTYDIECEMEFFEVKSTIIRDRKEVTINSQFQASAQDKDLFLVHCQFEPSEIGYSIDSLVSELCSLGYNQNLLNQKLKSLGYEIGRSSRKKRFFLNSMNQYTVNASFPSITQESFVGGILPIGVTKIMYNVSLDGLECLSLVDMVRSNDL